VHRNFDITLYNGFICFILGDPYLTACDTGTDSVETLAYKLQTPMNQPEESIKLSEHGESLK
jgi:hypothetical protein